jgi:3-oxoacyl-[acyl-carrier protein] reductase
MKSLSRKVVLVTGGTGGLGRAICQALAAEGASIVIGYNRSAEPAHALARELPATATGHWAGAAPVNDSVALTALAQDVKNRYGRCDMVVNCAGVTRFVPHADLNSLDDALIDEIFVTNVRGPIACVRAFLPLLQASGEGLVVNISSIAARTAMGSNIAYCASKAAVDNLTASLARALAPKVRVVSVAPGLADTEFVQGLACDWRDEQAQRTPLGRLATPQEVANAVIAAACHLTFSTGVVISVDGGRPLS